MEKIYTKNAPDAIGPYSQAVVVNGLVFTSGQIAINPASGNVEAETIETQTEQVCTNLKNVLEAAGSSLEKAVKTVCFLKNMEEQTQHFNQTHILINGEKYMDYQEDFTKQILQKMKNHILILHFMITM